MLYTCRLCWNGSLLKPHGSFYTASYITRAVYSGVYCLGVYIFKVIVDKDKLHPFPLQLYGCLV